MDRETLRRTMIDACEEVQACHEILNAPIPLCLINKDERELVEDRALDALRRALDAHRELHGHPRPAQL